MACLAYKPTSINVEGFIYTREDLIKKAVSVLNCARLDYSMNKHENKVTQPKR